MHALYVRMYVHITHVSLYVCTSQSVCMYSELLYTYDPAQARLTCPAAMMSSSALV